MCNLKRSAAGTEFARAVELQLLRETDNAKIRIGSDTRASRRERRERKAKQKQSAAHAEQRRQWLARYLQIPPLPRPVTPEAIAQTLRETTTVSLRPDACSITLTAAAPGDRTELLKLIGQYDHSPAPQVQSQLSSLPKLLTCLIVAHAAETVAKKFEVLGAKVELRPGWSE